MVKKILGESPLTYPLLGHMSSLDPRIFIANKETSAK